MKKTLITLLALASVASAQTPLPLLPDEGSQFLQKRGTYEWYEKNWESLSIGGMKPVTDELIKNSLKQNPELLNTGWRWSSGNRNDPWNGASKAKDNDYFNFTSVSHYRGIFMLATRKVSDLLTQSNEVLTSLTVSFKASGQSEIGFSAWVWDDLQDLEGESMPITLINETKQLNIGNNVVNTFTKEGLSLDANQTILFLWNAYDSYTEEELENMEKAIRVDNSITALSSSYTTAAIVPEPATTTLSLLALAGLAARRRRAAH